MDCRENTGLHVAAEMGFEYVATELIEERNVDCRVKNRNGVVALHFAAWGGEPSIVNLVLQAGADIEAEDKHVSTPLHYASANGQTRVVKLLCEKGADANGLRSANNKIGWTPLHFAAMNNDSRAVRWLLNNGATQQKDKWGRTPWQFADCKNFSEITRILSESSSDSTNGNFGESSCPWTPLHCAAFDEEQVPFRVFYDASADDVGEHWHAVSWAAEKDRRRVALLRFPQRYRYSSGLTNNQP